MDNRLAFRGWFYFRQGWSMYFAFIMAAINTLTVTYFLAIERYPDLKAIFPTFPQYIIIIMGIGIPLLVLIGYLHFKKSPAFRSETSIHIESNPFMRRLVVNTEIILDINMKLSNLIFKMSENKKLTKEELEELINLQKEYKKFLEQRTLSNEDDLSFVQGMSGKNEI